MEPGDEHVDSQLRALGRATPGSAERVAAAALAVDAARGGAIARFAAVAASLAAVVAALGLGLLGGRPWKEPATHGASPGPVRIMMLVHSTDGTAAIYGGAADEPEPAPGTGFVLSEGEPR